MEKLLLAILPAQYDVVDKKTGEKKNYKGVNVFTLNQETNQVSRYFVQDKNLELVGLNQIKVDKITDFYSVKTYLEEAYGKLKLSKLEVIA